MAIPARSEALETALRAALPPDYRDRAPELVHALLAAVASPDHAPPTIDPALYPLLSSLAGTEIRAGQSRISFDGAQLGDVTFQGDIAGRDIIRVTLTIAPAPTLLTPHEQRNRARMIRKVRDFWIHGVLERSLYREALLTLGLELRPEAVINPLTLLVTAPERAPEQLAAGTTIAEVFDAANGELLILGGPGAGKTTALLDLLRVLLDRAEGDPGEAIPVIFNLSSWSTRRLPLVEWLVEELNARYDVPRMLAQRWVAADQVLPLLDGLDEVRVEQRDGCLAAINAFRRSHGMVGIVVCSRHADYESLNTQLRARSAVLLQPLEPSQIDAYLSGAGTLLIELRTLIQQDAGIAELATSPLMLSTMMLAAQGGGGAWLHSGVSDGERRHQLFDAYIAAMLARRTGFPIEPTKLKAYLIRLARTMQHHSQTVFLLERLQPSWLPSRRAQVTYTILDRLGSAIVIGAIVGVSVSLLGYPPLGVLCFGMIAALAAGCFGGSPTSTLVAPDLPRLAVRTAVAYLGGSVLMGLIAWTVGFGNLALVAGFVGGMPLAIIAGLFGWPGIGPRQVVVVETLRWTSRSARRFAVSWFILGALLGFVGSLIGVALGMTEGAEALLLTSIWTIAGGLGAALFGVLFGGLVGDRLKAQMRPNEGIARSARSACIAFCLAGVVIAPIGVVLAIFVREQLLVRRPTIPPEIFFWVGDRWSAPVAGAVTYGLLVALGFGGYAVLSHLVLRLVLWGSGTLPLKLLPFLDAAAARVLLHKVGGGYLFVHRLLMDHFAQMDDTPGSNDGVEPDLHGSSDTPTPLSTPSSSV